MRKETKEKSRQTSLLRPYELKSIRCKNALNRELKHNKGDPNDYIAVREYFRDMFDINYGYTYTPYSGSLKDYLARTDNTGRIKEYLSVGSKYRIKSHFIKAYLAAKKNHFMLCINDIVFSCVSLRDIRFGDNVLRIYCNELACAWLYYGDIKYLEVL